MRIIATVFVLLLFSKVCFSAEICSYDHSKMKLSKDYAFTPLFSASKDLSSEICLLQVGEKSDKTRLARLASVWEAAALEQTVRLNEAGVDLTEAITLLAKSFADNAPGGMEVNRTPNKFWRVKVPNPGGRPQMKQGLVTDEVNQKCTDKTTGYGKPCVAVLEDFRMAVHAVNADKNRVEMETALSNIGLYSKAWDRYFDEARSLTPWELALNTVLYKKELQKDTFVMPPNYQWFLFHPSIVIENVADALDGSQQKEAFSLEWFGINRWNTKFPIGISAVSTYADRMGVDDTRHGVMLHLFNDYSIGYTGIGGDDQGIFITMDLLKLAQSKQQRFDSYKKKVEEYRSK